jgi:hypothetical protein
MKFSYNWIHELVDGLDVPAAEIGRLITLKTAECEGVEAHGAMLDDVCVARVLTAEKVEGTHLTLTTVDTGRYGVKQVIRAQLPRRHAHRLLAAGQEEGARRGKRWHVVVRRRTRHQPRRRWHSGVLRR